MYIHSGVCSATTPGVPAPVDCQNPTYVWEHVVGDWGLDNGHGLMTKTSDSIWEIDIDLATFYSNPTTISQGGQGASGPSTVKPQGATAYSMGFVFRNQDGSIGGITGGCTDFFIFNLNQGNTTVSVGLPGNDLPDSSFSVTITTPTNVDDYISASFKTVFPNPFSDRMTITYNQPVENTEDVEFAIYNTVGQKIRTIYQGAVDMRVSTLYWDGRTDTGEEVDGGVYYLVITDGINKSVEKVVKI